MTKAKIIHWGLSLFIILAGFVSWAGLRHLLYFDTAAESIFLVAGAFLALIFAFVLAVSIFDSYILILPAIGLAFGLFFVFFGIKISYLAIFFLGFGMIYFGVRKTLQKKQTHLRIEISETSRPAANAVLTVLALIISAIVYFSPPAQNFAVELRMPRILFNTLVNSFEGLLGRQGLIPAVSDKNFVLMNGVFLPETKDRIYNEINKELNFYLLRFRRLLPYGLAIVAFLSLRTLGFLFVGPAALMARGAMALLKKAGLATVRKEAAEREVIEL